MLLVVESEVLDLGSTTKSQFEFSRGHGDSTQHYITALPIHLQKPDRKYRSRNSPKLGKPGRIG